MTVADLLDRMPSSEITEWQAFFLLEQQDAEDRDKGRRR